MKIIGIDTNALVFRSVFNYERMLINKKDGNFILPPDYTYMSMIISCLKKIGVDKNTKVFLAQDDYSWRKNYDANYKAQRAGQREQHKLINWTEQFEKANFITQSIGEAGGFFVMRVKNCEADDILSVISDYYKNDEVIICTGDKDLYQLAIRPNTKIFSYNVKIKGLRGGFVKVDNPFQIVYDKIRKGDVSDNLIPGQNETEEDIELRKFLVDLINLPDFVTIPIKQELSHLIDRQPNLEALPYPDSLGKRFFDIYKKDNVITYDACVEYSEKRAAKKAKKAKEKRDAKKAKKDECNLVTNN